MSLPRALTALIAALAASLFLAAGAGAIACDPGRCATFSAPGATGPVVAGPDGALWFLGDGFVGRMDLSGNVTRFPAPVGPASDLTVGPDGHYEATIGAGALRQPTWVSVDAACRVYVSDYRRVVVFAVPGGC